MVTVVGGWSTNQEVFLSSHLLLHSSELMATLDPLIQLPVPTVPLLAEALKEKERRKTRCK